MSDFDVIRDALRIPFGSEQVAEYDRALPEALAALDALQARIERVEALPKKWEARSDYWRSQPYPPPKELTVLQENLAKELRAALAAPIGSTEEGE